MADKGDLTAMEKLSVDLMTIEGASGPSRKFKGELAGPGLLH